MELSYVPVYLYVSQLRVQDSFQCHMQNSHPVTLECCLLKAKPRAQS